MAEPIPSDIVVDFNVAVPMKDGVRLAVDVFRPSAPGRYPVILIRTPYNKYVTAPQMGVVGALDPLWAAREGYVVVIQDVRGTFASHGTFRPFHNEAEDGAATVEWAAAQAWSNGAVAMTGGSYMGATQLLAATRTPAALRCMIPGFTSSEYYDGWFYQGGAFQLGFALMWAAGVAYTDLLCREARGDDVSVERGGLEAVVGDPWAAYRILPLADLPRQVPGLAHYGEWLAHPDRDDYWNALAINRRYSAIDAPSLHVAGWNDIFLKGSLENFAGLRSGAASEHARTNQRLIVTPWGHGGPSEVVGDLWFGAPAGAFAMSSLQSWVREFVEPTLDGSESLASPPVRLFVMGAKQWRDEQEWPLARAVQTRFCLRSDGRLTREEPADEAPDEYRYDPADPVPTIGGNTLLPGGGFFQGPRDRRTVHERSDVLVYRTEPLAEDTEVTGPLIVTLHVATSARDTDFTVGLIDFYPDGRGIGIADGILRLRYRNGFARQHLSNPGDTYSIEVDLAATSNVFKAGHRIGLEISSSNFPRFDRNPNHGGVIAEATDSDFVTAHQHVFHDANRLSFITLPLID
jgi:putative CocE/NonD family hydrolase